uniref:Ig-like domain-containing protein n=1 Tax=Neolamprologus brichardi TaxID=32507 RepID=A0A3Q4I998_NEOBR
IFDLYQRLHPDTRAVSGCHKLKMLRFAINPNFSNCVICTNGPTQICSFIDLKQSLHSDFCSLFTLSALQVHVDRSIGATLTCQSSCQIHDSPSYIWYKNGQKISTGGLYWYSDNLKPSDSYSCAVRDFSSPSVCTDLHTDKYLINLIYFPKLPSVSVSPSAEIVEGSSVTLTCSSDANPAANYTWYKEEQPISQEKQITFRSIRSSDSGEYYCTAENEVGRRSSEVIFIKVKCESRHFSYNATQKQGQHFALMLLKRTDRTFEKKRKSAMLDQRTSHSRGRISANDIIRLTGKPLQWLFEGKCVFRQSLNQNQNTHLLKNNRNSKC